MACDNWLEAGRKILRALYRATQLCRNYIGAIQYVLTPIDLYPFDLSHQKSFGFSATIVFFQYVQAQEKNF